jgi:putative ABC transport system permease protein
MLLAGVSTTAGCLVAVYALRLISRIPFSTDYPFDPVLSLDWRVIAFAAALAVLAALAFGIGPALPVTKAAAFDSLRTRSAGSGAARARASLVVLQVGLSVVLLVAATLFVRTVRHLEQRDIGLSDLDHLVTMQATVSRAVYKTPDAVARFYDALLTRVTQLPGVRHAALASYPPLTDPGLNIRFAIEGQDTTTAGDALTAPIAVVSPDFFATVGIPRVQGRTFEASDAAGTAKVLVVNRSFVRRFMPSGEVVGRRVKPLVQNQQDWYTVVGVVDDVGGPRADEPPPATAYVLYAHMPLPWATVIVRTEGSPRSIVPSIRRAVAAVDPEQPLSAIRSMRDLWAERVVQPTLRSRVVALFGVIAVTLALIGLYGLVAYSITLKARDFAVRLALGAEPQHLVRDIVRQTLVIAAIGIGLGLIGAIVSGRLMSHLLFGVSPADPLTLVSVVISLGLAAGLAAYIPARRVRSVDPLTVLRSE